MHTAEARLANWSRTDRELTEARRRLQRARDTSWVVNWATYDLELDIRRLQHEKHLMMFAALVESAPAIEQPVRPDREALALSPTMKVRHRVGVSRA